MLKDRERDEQAELYEGMLAIAREQRKVLQEEDVDVERLMTLIDRRQQLINKLDALDGDKAWNDERYSLMTQIKELDKNNEGILRRRVDEIKKKMAEVQQNKKANKAYESELLVNDGVFVDFSG